MLKQYRLGLKKNHVLDHETRESRPFPCYRLKINDFLSHYNQNLKIDIFTPLQQIPCYHKSRLGTLRFISWWRVTLDLSAIEIQIPYYLLQPVSAIPQQGYYKSANNSGLISAVSKRTWTTVYISTLAELHAFIRWPAQLSLLVGVFLFATSITASLA